MVNTTSHWDFRVQVIGIFDGGVGVFHGAVLFGVDRHFHAAYQINTFFQPE